jgi:hypothetical protein
MSRSIHSLVSKKATNKDVLFNNRLAKFVNPPIHNGDLYISRDLIVDRNTYLNNLDVSGNLNVKGDTSLRDTDISGNLMVTQSASVSGNLSVSGDCYVQDNVDISGNLTVQGNLLVYGTISARQYLPGQVIKMSMYSNVDLGQNGKTINASVTDTIFSISYTPSYATSYLVVEYVTVYALDGAGLDDMWSYLYVNDGNDNRISFAYQKWVHSQGGGTRSGTIFPIIGRYTNTNRNAKQIRVDVYNHTDADPLTIYSSESTWLKITEIGR